ncbi:hypothetical protein JCM10213_008428 [Rhodosporidiobolus nylandii]
MRRILHVSGGALEPTRDEDQAVAASAGRDGRRPRHLDHPTAPTAVPGTASIYTSPHPSPPQSNHLSAASSAADRLSQQLSSAPSFPRMRRAPRLSPNSRQERPAPSTLPSSTFSASAFTSTARPLQRRSSLPSSSSRRQRASSVDLSSRSRDTSRSRKHLDPDEHWLSEDESNAYTRASAPQMRGRPALPRRRSREDHEPDDEEPPKLVIGAGTRLDSPSRHAIHHRPAKAARSSPPAEEEHKPKSKSPSLPFSAILPSLLSHLICPACHHLLRDPATLACGHSRCLSCALPLASALASPALSAATASTISTPFPSPSMDGSASSAAVPSGMPGDYVSHTPPTHPSKPSSDKEPSHTACVRADCTLPSTAFPPHDLHVDFALRKIVEAVRRAVPNIDALLAPEKAAEPAASGSDVSLEALLQDTQLSSAQSSKHPAPGELPRTGSGDSGSSGGGEDETRAEDDGKRVHKTKKEWRTSKRTRVDELEEPAQTPTPLPPSLALSFVPPSFLADLQNDCECQVCVQLVHDPVTTPCGHSFCRGCLARSYDHSDRCPLCRAALPSLAFFRWQRANLTLASVISTALPDLAAERAASVKEDELAQLASVPIFVCTTAWPGIKTFLHIFEPRYRLMVRRALELPDKSFGMVLPAKSGEAGAVHEFGTMLRITQCQQLEDGRMILQTVGTHRFRIVERGMLDGYNVGRIERVDDVSPEQEAELERAALARNDQPDEEADYGAPGHPSRPPMTGNMELPTDALMQICLDFIRTLRAGSSPWIIERLNRTVGETPTNPHDFTWFAAEVFPVEDHVKVTLLQTTSVRERLRLIVFWIEQFRSSWWYTRGCTIC